MNIYRLPPANAKAMMVQLEAYAGLGVIVTAEDDGLLTIRPMHEPASAKYVVTTEGSRIHSETIGTKFGDGVVWTHGQAPQLPNE